MSDVSLQVTAVANATEALIVFAELGMGIACVPDFTVHRQLADGSLRRILCGCLEHQVSLRAIWPSSRFPSPKQRAFIDFIARHGFVSSDCAMIDQDSVKCSPEATNATAGRAIPVHPIPSKTAATAISLNM
jgi:hypothetical protein